MELIVPLRSQSDLPLYEQIYEYIKNEIKSGRLKAMTRLPSTRTLAENLKVSRSTTQMAYEQLLSEGYIEAVPCKGYYVSKIEELVDVGHNGSEVFVLPVSGGKEEYLVDFSPRGIDLDSFPFNAWRKITKNTLVDDNKAMFAAGDAQGELSLREAIGEYLHTARGVKCHANQLIIGAGSEYLLMLLHQILGPGRVIAMENPTYKQAYRVFQSLGCQVCPVDMDRYGMDVNLLNKCSADLAYIMPSHQYPMGIVMPVKRRQELLLWAGQKKGRYLIEDDYDSEFRYKGKPIPALQGMDQADRVIYIGTFSKSIAPAIRVSYLVLPPQLLREYKQKAGFYASTVSRIDQNILHQFIVGGHYERHLNRMRAIYKGKHDALMSSLKVLERDFTVKGENAGLHVLLTSKKGRSEEWLVERAKKAGVCVYGLSGYFIDPPDGRLHSTVVLGYANLSEEEIRQGAGLLAKAWQAAEDERKGEI